MYTPRSTPIATGLTLALMALLGSGLWSGSQAYDRVTNDANNSQLPQVAAGSVVTMLHAVYQSTRSGKEEVFYKRSTDSGVNWSAEVQLSTPDNANSITPAIAVAGDYVYVIYADYAAGNGRVDLKLCRSSCSGKDWLGIDQSPTIHRTTLPGPGGACYSPSIATYESDRPDVCVAYHNHSTGNYEVYADHSTNHGDSWLSSPWNVSNSPGGDSQNARITYNGLLHVVWQETTGGAAEVFWRHGFDGSWNENPTKLSGGPGTNSIGPDISSSAAYVDVVWFDYRNSDVQVYHRAWSDHTGFVWTAEQPIGGGPGPGSSYFPAVANAWWETQVVWENYWNAGNYEIYRNHSGDSGCYNYPTPPTWDYGYPFRGARVTTDNGASQRADVAVVSTNGNLFWHIVWQDKTEGNWKIFHTCISTGWSKAPGQNSAFAGRRPSPPSVASGDAPSGSETGAALLSPALPAPAGQTAAAPFLVSATPSPFAGQTIIRYTLPGSARVNLRVYGAAGQVVRSLLGSEQAAGVHAVAWDGKDDGGREVGGGVYFCSVDAGTMHGLAKVLCVRR